MLSSCYNINFLKACFYMMKCFGLSNILGKPKINFFSVIKNQFKKYFINRCEFIINIVQAVTHNSRVLRKII